eukprot:7448374-Pyramimonas_sp.AAC.2
MVTFRPPLAFLAQVDNAEKTASAVGVSACDAPPLKLGPLIAEEAEVAGTAAALHQLDLQLMYLWRVHRVDYYGAREEAGVEEMQREIAAWGQRTGRAAHNAAVTDASAPGPASTGVEDRMAVYGRWAEGVDTRWAARAACDPLAGPCWRAELAQLEEEWLMSNVRKIDEGKYGCNQVGSCAYALTKPNRHDPPSTDLANPSACCHKLPSLSIPMLTDAHVSASAAQLPKALLGPRLCEEALEDEAHRYPGGGTQCAYGAVL